MKFLQERHISYVKRQFEKPVSMRNPILPQTSMFKDLLVFILIVAGIISMLSNNVESTIVIFSVIILNAVLGTVQHFKAEQSLDSLKALSAPCAKVIRDSKKDIVKQEVKNDSGDLFKEFGEEHNDEIYELPF